MQNNAEEIKKLLGIDLGSLTNAVVQAVVRAEQTQSKEDALLIRDELHRLPDYLMTEVLNDVIIGLVKVDPNLCRWFILDVFLQDAEPEGRADVAERINLLLADLQSS
ncbi:hypothetical protein [Pseudanabaena sp. FACHB-2040]|uniref:hypothetical protein n=1 Tax=Pseudanabaena sp. FACHB-2040 TaxID=2692859 RepID=UPI00168226AA|nr:hypothetical protein [Pseudanabaena sp. FACHB-2040]MBD2256114.1 hypothetical protein [Pseudanabaena sp. FACHB-2040]